MFLISREFTFCYGHRLLNYEGKCSHPHGHNGRVRITLSADSLNKTGMVRDFSELKAIIGAWIERHLDHRMILARNDSLVEVLSKMGEPVLLVAENPTAELLAKLIYDVVEKERFPVDSVEFWETDKCRAVYKNPSPQP